MPLSRYFVKSSYNDTSIFLNFQLFIAFLKKKSELFFFAYIIFQKKQRLFFNSAFFKALFRHYHLLPNFGSTLNTIRQIQK
jgi:hypothetical protein